MKANAVAESTRRARVGTFAGNPDPKTGRLCGYIGDLAEMTRSTDICDLATQDIENYFSPTAAKRLTGNPGSYNGRLGALKAFMAWAVINRYISPQDAAILIGGRKRDNDRGREQFRISIKDSERVLDKAGERSARSRIICAIGFNSGFRDSEVKAITLGGLDFKSRQTTVFRRKVRDELVMPWTPQMHRELLRWLAWYADAAEYDAWEDMVDEHPEWPLVPAVRKGGANNRIIPGSPTKTTFAPVVRYALKDARLLPAGETGIGLHTLRRSIAVAMDEQLGQNDESLTFVSKLLGHQSTQTTLRYLRRDRGQARFEEIMRGGLTGRLPADETAEVIPLSKLAAQRAARKAQ